MTDLNNAVIEYLLECPKVKNNPLFFNAIQATSDSKQFVTVGSATSTNKNYLDGSVGKEYIFTIIDFRSVVYQPIVTVSGYPSENVETMLDVQGIIDWISTQNKNRHFPNFGDNMIVESIEATSNNPNLNGIDTNVTPALAKYSISIKIDYIDETNKIWS